MRPIQLTYLLLVITCWSCASTNGIPKDPYAEFFNVYVGSQGDWKTQPGSFATVIKGVPFYYGFPAKPYEVIGRVVVRKAENDLMAKCAKAHRADALIIAEEVEIESKVEKGVTFFGSGWMWSTPDKIKSDRVAVTTALLIRFTQSP